MHTIELTDAELAALRYWIANLSFTGTKAELKKTFELHDAIEQKLQERSKLAPLAALPEMQPD